MTEPTADQVLLKAKQLARDEGRLRLWARSTTSCVRRKVASPTIRSGPNI
jgi:hypothetical protein